MLRQTLRAWISPVALEPARRQLRLAVSTANVTAWTILFLCSLAASPLCPILKSARLFFSSPALAQDHDNGHGKGHDKHYQEARDDDRGDYHYKHHEQEIRGWYTQHEGHLPPGLAKRDQLPLGLEKQLLVRGTLPAGLQKRMYPCPEELERRLPPPPPDCTHLFAGGPIVLLNRKTNVVIDIFPFEIT